MDNVERYLENVRVISLLSRTDRRKEISAILNQHRLPFSFFDAHYDVKNKPIINCAISHLETLSNFYESELGLKEYVLILEDDCLFVDGFLDKFNSLDLSDCPNWDSFRLGCLHTKQPIPINKGLVQTVFPLDAHAIIYKTTEIPKYIALLNESLKVSGIWDLYIAQQINRVSIIAAYPNLAYQRVGNSDIAERNYSNYDLNGVQNIYSHVI